MNRLTLFGGAALHAESGPIVGRAVQRHRIALLALLSTTQRSSRSRDQLVALLWPDADGERGRKLLSDSIYRINQALGAEAILGSGDDLRLDRDLLGGDVADFERAMELENWKDAVDAYAGPFLDGFYLPGAGEFDHWMELERSRYARGVAKALEALAADAGNAGRGTESVELWQRLAAIVPDDSRIAMQLMRALDAAGNRAGALRHAKIHSLLLRETLGLEPDQSVQALANQIATRAETSCVAECMAELSLPATTNECVVESSPVAVVAPVISNPPAKRQRRRWMRRLRAAVALTSAATAGALMLTAFKRGQPLASTIEARGGSIAVLPFRNVSADTNAFFADGVSEELTYLLTRTPALRVASRTSAFAFRDTKLDVREVGRRLSVDWILEGSVRRSGNRVRIVAQLTDAKNGYQVWSESYDRTSTDVFAVQEQIAAAIAARLAAPTDTAMPDSKSPVVRPTTSGRGMRRRVTLVDY